MPDLFPTFDMPDLVGSSVLNDVQYPASPLFDFATGNFIIDGAGRFVMADGYIAWAQWCQKAVMTERFAYLAYSTDYGIELRNARNQSTRAAIRSEIERAITEALLVDPRTATVKDFIHQFDGDSITVSFTVVPTIGAEQRLEVTL